VYFEWKIASQGKLDLMDEWLSYPLIFHQTASAVLG